MAIPPWITRASWKTWPTSTSPTPRASFWSRTISASTARLHSTKPFRPSKPGAWSSASNGTIMMRGIIMAQSSLACTGGLVTAVAMRAAPAPAWAESPAREIVASLVATPIAPPNPVLGADARRPLVYEIVLMDIGGSTIALEKIEVLDANGDAVLATLEGEALAKILRLTGAGKGTALPAGGSGVLFMDVTLAEDAIVPRALKHRFQVAVSKQPSSGNDRDPTPHPPQTQSVVGAPLDVGTPAVVIALLLEGPRWGDGVGGCLSIPY